MWCLYHTLLTKAQRIYAEEGVEEFKEWEVVDDFQETVFSRHIGADAHMNSPRLLQHAQDLPKLKPEKNLNMREGKWYEAAPLAEEAFDCS